MNANVKIECGQEQRERGWEVVGKSRRAGSEAQHPFSDIRY